MKRCVSPIRSVVEKFGKYNKQKKFIFDNPAEIRLFLFRKLVVEVSKNIQRNISPKRFVVEKNGKHTKKFFLERETRVSYGSAVSKIGHRGVQGKSHHSKITDTKY